MEDYANMIKKREAEREKEFKMKEERIKRILESGQDIIGKPKDTREARQDAKLKVWEERVQKRIQEEDEKEKATFEAKKIAQKESLEQQMKEKKARKEFEDKIAKEQAEIWVSDAERFRNYEQSKVDYRKQQQAKYAEVLKQQMQEKYEEKKANSRLLQIRDAQWKKRPYG